MSNQNQPQPIGTALEAALSKNANNPQLREQLKSLHEDLLKAYVQTR